MTDVSTVASIWDLDNDFVLGCIGAIAPEAWRLYNLRINPVFKCSDAPGYLLYSIPFIVVAGIITWVTAPSTTFSAFYTGMTAPIIVNTGMREITKSTKELADEQKESATNKSHPNSQRQKEESLDDRPRTFPLESKETLPHSPERPSQEQEVRKVGTFTNLFWIAVLLTQAVSFGVIDYAPFNLQNRKNHSDGWYYIYPDSESEAFNIIGFLLLLAVVVLVFWHISKSIKFKQFLKGL